MAKLRLRGRFEIVLGVLLAGCVWGAGRRFAEADRPADGENSHETLPTRTGDSRRTAVIDIRPAVTTRHTCESRTSIVDPSWKAFREAVANGAKQEVARRTHFPLSVAGWPHPLSRDEFSKDFERLFSASIRKQIAHGELKRVTRRDLAQAQKDGLDPCGSPGELLLQLPAEMDVDYENDDEAFLRLIFKREHDALVLWKIIGCS